MLLVFDMARYSRDVCTGNDWYTVEQFTQLNPAAVFSIDWSLKNSKQTRSPVFNTNLALQPNGDLRWRCHRKFRDQIESLCP